MTHASIFSGIGACDLAASWMGWKNQFWCEINPFCQEILRYWFKESKEYEDIKNTDFREWRGRVSVLSGGFPCQGFSTAGLGLGVEDDRFLWPEMLRVIAEVQPTYIVGENVNGIFSSVQPGCESVVATESTLFGENHFTQERGVFVVERICDDLEREGYSVIPFVIPACAVGAPHKRERVWFVAKRTASDSELLRLQHNLERGGQGDVLGTTGAGRKNVLSPEVQLPPSAGSRPRTSRTEERLGWLSSYRRRVLSGLPASQMPAERWRGFPETQPTIYSGDDGLRPIVDALTIPFNRWRIDSLKAYGNSMCVPVVYEIFRAIQQDYENR